VQGRRGAQAIGPLIQDVLLGNSAGEHAPRHLDSMPHCGKNFSAGVSGADLGRENLAPKVGKGLVRERLGAHRQSVRRTNSDPGIQPGGVCVEERKRMRGALFTRARLDGYLPQPHQQGDMFMHGMASGAPENGARPQCVRSRGIMRCETDGFATFSFLNDIVKRAFPAPHIQSACRRACVRPPWTAS